MKKHTGALKRNGYILVDLHGHIVSRGATIKNHEGRDVVIVDGHHTGGKRSKGSITVDMITKAGDPLHRPGHGPRRYTIYNTKQIGLKWVIDHMSIKEAIQDILSGSSVDEALSGILAL